MKYNGQDVISYRTLKPLVGSSQPGDTITLDLLRDRKLITIKVEVGTLEADDAPPASADKPARPAEPSALPADHPLGATVVALTDDERRTAKVVSGGVRVTEVLAGPAREAGLIVGDVVLSIAGQEIGSRERFAEVVDRLTPGQSVPMLVQRQGAPLFLALSVPAKTPAAAP